MDRFNNILENIKIMISSVYGKLIIIIFIIIALATFFLATVQNNDTAFSFFRSIMSAIVSCLVILGTYFLITKIVGKEIIENNKSNKNSILTETDEFDFSHEDTLNDNDSNNPTFNRDGENIDQLDINSLDVNDLDNDKTNIMDRLNSVDKNPKVGYPNAIDINDIGSSDGVESILSDNKINSTPIDTSLTDDSFIDFSATPSTAATGDTETMAKAVRTMISKDKKQEN